MIKKILSLLLKLFIFLLPLGVIVRFKLGTNVFITPQDVVALVIFLITLIYYKKNIFKHKFSSFFKYQMFFIFIGFSSLVVNYLQHGDINLTASIGYLLRYLIYINLFEVTKIIKVDGTLLKKIFLSSLIFLILGFLQLIFIYDLRPIFRLGWDEHLYRLVSTFIDPNFAGVQYVLIMLFMVYFVMVNKFKNSLFYILSSVYSGIAVFVTYSRTALVAMLMSFVIYSILFKKYLILLFFLVIGICMIFLVSDFNIEGLNPLRTVSSKNRLINIKDTIEVISRNPIYGVGFNAYRYAQIRYGLRSSLNLESNADAGADNSYLFVFATTGIIGLIFFVLSYVFLIKELSLRKHFSHKLLFLMIIVVLTSSLFINVLFFTPIIGWYLVVHQVLKENI